MRGICFDILQRIKNGIFTSTGDTAFAIVEEERFPSELLLLTGPNVRTAIIDRSVIGLYLDRTQDTLHD